MYLKLVKEGARDLEDLFAVLQNAMLHNNIEVQDADSFERLANQKYSKIF